MADKKVDRSRPDRTINPTQQMTSSLSERGTINMAQPTHDKGKSALLDKFRRREERWRREQSIHDREAAAAAKHQPNDAQAGPQGAEAQGAKAENADEGEGGAK